jgi:hypothetical protein
MRLVSIMRVKQKRRSSPPQQIDHADDHADDHYDATQRGRLHPTGQPPAQRSADQRSDFFFTTLRQDGSYQWWYFYCIPSPYSIGSTKLAFDGTPPDQHRFGDFNGDGITDVFTLVRQCQIYLPVIQR